MSPSPIHAGCLALRVGAGWRGVLIAGAPGRGKSDLGLRLLLRGARLVSDDYSHVWPSGDGLYAAAPERIAGRIEVRGLGIVAEPARPLVRVALFVEAAEAEVERLPPPARRSIAGVSLPMTRLDLRQASAPDRIVRALWAQTGPLGARWDLA